MNGSLPYYLIWICLSCDELIIGIFVNVGSFQRKILGIFSYCTSEQICTRSKHITKRSVEHMAQWSHALSQLPNGRGSNPALGVNLKWTSVPSRVSRSTTLMIICLISITETGKNHCLHFFVIINCLYHQNVDSRKVPG